jgi:hypothetical protein
VIFPAGEAVLNELAVPGAACARRIEQHLAVSLRELAPHSL